VQWRGSNYEPRWLGDLTDLNGLGWLNQYQMPIGP
jgi:hypothetical protein